MNQDLLYKYFKGNANIEEEKQILDWVDASDENRKAFQKERMLYDIALFSEEKQSERLKRKTRILPILQWTARIAAVMIILFGSGLLFKDYRYNKSAQLQTVAVPAGQRAQITLADGTKVWLNSQSTLTYASNFGRQERNVLLDGEAYFEVAKNPEKRFIVSTSHQSQIEVLGTHFNVEAYEDEPDVSTTLVEGQVCFHFSDKDYLAKKVVMKPGQRLVYSSTNGDVQLYATSCLSETAWKDGKIIFNNTPLDVALRMLEKRFNVTFKLKNARLKTNAFTGTFTEQRLERILEYFKISSKIQWRYLESPDIRDERSIIEVY